MKRAGFTMIELIFVIVILGILSAVALPRFIGVSEQAQAGKCKALIGTMNRTIFPALWSDMVLNGIEVGVAFTEGAIIAQIDIPTECGNPAQYAALVVAGTQIARTVGATNFTVDRVTEATTSNAPFIAWNRVTAAPAAAGGTVTP